MTKLISYFLLRNKVKYEIIVLLFVAIHTSIQNGYSLYGITYSVTFLSILYIIYFNVLVRQKGRINLLYKGSTVKHLKYDIIKSISIISMSLFVVIVFIDIFLLNVFYLILYHLGTLIVFIISTSIISINIEKRNDNPNVIVTFKEGCKTIGLGIFFYILMTIFLALI